MAHAVAPIEAEGNHVLRLLPSVHTERWSDPAYQAYLGPRVAFVVAPVIFGADKELDLRAPDEDSEGVGVGSQKARRQGFSAGQDKFVTEWSYCPGDDEQAEDNSPLARD